MKTYALVSIHVICAVILTTVACSGSKSNQLKGDWKSKDNKITLKITDKQFTMNSESPLPEDYFVKGDTIYTSFEGNLPYTKFVIKAMDDHNLKLLDPDSVIVDFTR